MGEGLGSSPATHKLGIVGQIWNLSTQRAETPEVSNYIHLHSGFHGSLDSETLKGNGKKKSKNSKPCKEWGVMKSKSEFL